MKKFLLIGTIALAFTAMSSVTSSKTAHAQAYGEAGCGLGSMLFGTQPGIIQVLAATTNGFLGTQTFGITSGTSNCGAGAVAVTTKEFVEGNRQAIAKDIARGSGETIVTLSEIAGCADSGAVARKLQMNYRTIFPSANISNVQVSNSVVGVLKSDASLSCTKV